MGNRHEFVPESFIKALQAGISGFGNLSERHQFHLAKLVWEEGLKHRRHKKYPECMSIGYLELARRFGRGSFDVINTKLGLFEASPNWYWQGSQDQKNATRWYTLTPSARATKDDYLHASSCAEDRLLYLDGIGSLKVLRSVPGSIAAKVDDDPDGITATAWRGCQITNRVPVNIEQLRILQAQLAKMLANSGQNDFFAAADRNDIERRLNAAAQLLRLAQTDVAGQGYVLQRYAECKTGRLYVHGLSLQTVPRLVRKAALHGLHDYDIENCHFAIFEQMASRYGYAADAIRSYLGNKKAIRLGIANRTGITIEQAKACLLAIMFGARTTTWSANAIPEEIGVFKAKILLKDPEFAAIANDIKRGRRAILKHWPRRRTALLNDLGKPISTANKDEVILAHLIQGIEAKALRSVVKLFGGEIVLLMHDGFVTRHPINIATAGRQIRAETGYELMLSNSVIQVPPNLEFSRTTKAR